MVCDPAFLAAALTSSSDNPASLAAFLAFLYAQDLRLKRAFCSAVLSCGARLLPFSNPFLLCFALAFAFATLGAFFVGASLVEATFSASIFFLLDLRLGAAFLLSALLAAVFVLGFS